jgi:hypothetical protein
VTLFVLRMSPDTLGGRRSLCLSRTPHQRFYPEFLAEERLVKKRKDLRRGVRRAWRKRQSTLTSSRTEYSAPVIRAQDCRHSVHIDLRPGSIP